MLMHPCIVRATDVGKSEPCLTSLINHLLSCYRKYHNPMYAYKDQIVPQNYNYDVETLHTNIHTYLD